MSEEREMLKWLIIITLAILLIPLLLSCKTEKAPTPQRKPLLSRQSPPFVVINDETLFVKISSTPKERALGLMFRDSLPEKNGMLFIFEFEAKHTFWMKNTKIPLSIAFINSKYTVIDIQDMVPLSQEEHAPRFPCLFALETNQHWFKKHGIRVGDSVELHF
jgi:uncharacterized membrane protein (UPF0127 family)